MIGFVIPLEPLAIGIEALPDLIVALMCLLVVVAAWVIMAVVFEVFGNISVLGAHPFGLAAGLASGLLKAAMNKLGGPLMKYLDAVGHFFYGLAMTLWRPLYVLGDTITGLTTNLLGLSQSTSSRFTDTQGQIVAGDQATARVAANELTNNVGTLNDRITAERDSVNADITANVDAVNGEIATTNHQVEVDFAAANSHADDLYNQGVGVSQSLANQVEVHADTLFTDATNHANDLYNQAVGTAQSLANQVELHADQITAAAIPTAVAQAVAQLQPQLSKVQTAVDDCLEPLCDTVTPNASRLGHLGNLFKDLEALAFDALIVALAAEALHDPAAVVNDVKTVVDDVGSPFMSAFRDLVGA